MADSFMDSIEGAATLAEQTGGFLTIQTSDGEMTVLHPPYSVGKDYVSGSLVKNAREPRRVVRFEAILWYERRTA